MNSLDEEEIIAVLNDKYKLLEYYKYEDLKDFEQDLESDRYRRLYDTVMPEGRKIKVTAYQLNKKAYIGWTGVVILAYLDYIIRRWRLTKKQKFIYISTIAELIAHTNAQIVKQKVQELIDKGYLYDVEIKRGKLIYTPKDERPSGI